MHISYRWIKIMYNKQILSRLIKLKQLKIYLNTLQIFFL